MVGQSTVLFLFQKRTSQQFMCVSQKFCMCKRSNKTGASGKEFTLRLLVANLKISLQIIEFKDFLMRSHITHVDASTLITFMSPGNDFIQSS
jgi:hypothetical protein